MANEPSDKEQPTPRTDAEEQVDSLHWHLEHNYHGPMVVPAEFARQLERELAETQAKYERLQQSAVGWQERIEQWDKHDSEWICVLKPDLIHVARQCRARGMTETAGQLEAMLERAPIVPHATECPISIASADSQSSLPVDDERQKMGAVLYYRVPSLDKRIARGDDFAGDAWVRYTAVGHRPDADPESPTSHVSEREIEDLPDAPATPAENMEVLYARLNDKMSPAERRELQEVIGILRSTASSVAPSEAMEAICVLGEKLSTVMDEDDLRACLEAHGALRAFVRQNVGTSSQLPTVRNISSDAHDEGCQKGLADIANADATPRTDAQTILYAQVGDDMVECVPICFARDLERELTSTKSHGALTDEAAFLRRVRNALCPPDGAMQPMTEEQRAVLDMIGDRLMGLSGRIASARGESDG